VLRLVAQRVAKRVTVRDTKVMVLTEISAESAKGV
jgi:hypothetical protein